ncbi:hypothetical protein NC653_026643 [Populus alba x Populus x berolinensis]|uniref:Uncharacterized protein n=1 Tax=Populus alba x Populus x berolinensis TaxID=444605 RepID=A0AAD6QAJ2_9ROSI|nr:hypothetical protein NC653_026643 [Populus alba x Populus x berolinensis]
MAASYSHQKDEGYLNTNNISRIQSLPHDSNKITLPDGTVKEGKRWQSSPKEKSRRILGRVWLRMR